VNILSVVLAIVVVVLFLALVIVKRRSRPSIDAGRPQSQLVVSGNVANYGASTPGSAGSVTVGGIDYTIAAGVQIQGDLLLVHGQRATLRAALDTNGEIKSASVTTGISVPTEIYVVELAYLMILLLGATLFNDPTGAHGLWKLLHLLPDPVGPIPLAIPWYGALGAVTIGLFGLFQHSDSWDSSYLHWHIARPFTGGTLGLLAYLIFLVVVDATGAQAKKAGHPEYVYYLVAFIVGFREQTFTTLIKRAADLFIGPGDNGGTAVH